MAHENKPVIGVSVTLCVHSSIACLHQTGFSSRVARLYGHPPCLHVWPIRQDVWTCEASTDPSQGTSMAVVVVFLSQIVSQLCSQPMNVLSNCICLLFGGGQVVDSVCVRGGRTCDSFLVSQTPPLCMRQTLTYHISQTYGSRENFNRTV